MNVRGSLSAVALAVGAAVLAGCSGNGTPGASPSAAAPGGLGAGTISSSSACGLLTTEDVQTAINESITATRELPGASAALAGQIQECMLTTDGPPLAGDAAASLTSLANMLIGNAPQHVDLTTGGIAVVVANTSFAVNASPSVSDLPSGVAAVPDVGRQAYAVSSPTGGGLAFSQVTTTKAILLVDLEGKQVTVDQLSTLLKAAVDHA